MTAADPPPAPEPDSAHDPACEAAHADDPPPGAPGRLVLVFASPVAREVAALADRLGWPVTIVDPDAARLTNDMAPAARMVTMVAAADLDARCDVVVCDHDRPELGDVLAEALAQPLRWVGVMGSRRHVAPHIAALQRRGLPADQISRVHRPIGLDIGSKTPPEIAVSAVAGLLASRTGRPGGFFPR